ncbi:exosome complex component RRP45B-like isoform X3 [Phalaenopsis equestris]|uniref:exosome complex component RRP45B-like isoform X3 n=1 Tax=Phalaenopsis equestris TaxID=78828 RepID=UPI0009E23CB8|nr:exosome complex component RRP45B-like isoform X3 [Phalaenopsis equestris]
MILPPLTPQLCLEDGSSEGPLGEAHVIGFVSGQVVQPYRDRPNEGTLAIFTEFSPMADPAFEPGRPGEFAIELGRLIDRGLRNLIDTANIAALAALLTYRKSECTLGGENGQDVVIHDPEVSIHRLGNHFL